MFLENVFPPIPSELIMPLAGFNAVTGKQNLVLVIAAGPAGSLAGALFWYWIGKKVGMDRLKRFGRRFGRWLTISPDELDQVQRVVSAPWRGGADRPDDPHCPHVHLGPSWRRRDADGEVPRL